MKIAGPTAEISTTGLPHAARRPQAIACCGRSLGREQPELLEVSFRKGKAISGDDAGLRGSDVQRGAAKVPAVIS
jgi:hypothetical protein